MAPSSFANKLPSSPPHDTEEHHHENLLLTDKQDKMVANIIKAVFQYATAAHPESADQHFNVVARADRNSVKVKGKFDDAATARLVEATSTATARLVEVTSAATARVVEAKSTGTQSVALPFLLSGLAGLAIWRMTGRAKMPSARLGVKPTRVPFALRAKSIQRK